MQIYYKNCLFFTLLLLIYALLTCITNAESVDEIIEAQKELNVTSKEKAKNQKAQKQSLEETKDAIIMGKKEYDRTCSLCHGLDAKGHGIYAFELKTAPTDLTLLERNNHGVFPFSKLYKIIDGREIIKSHGVRDMPIWGNRYASEIWLDTHPRNSETFIRGRIFELLLYLETLQK
jgi:hypothetical protein